MELHHSANEYVQPLVVALLGFPVISLLVLIPFAYRAYRRYGRLPMWRTCIFFSFLYYALVVFFLTNWPFPAVTPGFCKFFRSDTNPQLDIFFIVKYLRDTVRPLTFWNIVSSFGGFQILANVLLFLPLGVYLRYYFERSFAATVLIVCGTSFFLEMTQLTGLWHLYPCPYRLFDVDDILTNTLGGMIGYGLMVAVQRVCILPAARPGRRTYLPSVRVTRRLIAWVIDGTIVCLGALVAYVLLCSAIYATTKVLPPVRMMPLIQHSLVFGVALLDFVVIPIVWNGVTIGKYVVALELVAEDQSVPSVAQIVSNYSVLALPVTILGVIQGGCIFMGWPFVADTYIVMLQMTAVMLYVMPMFWRRYQDRPSLGRLVSRTVNVAMSRRQMREFAQL